ncbi:hypothetical protein F4X73_06535 [Candidatus Poribacteria bacterium]|nr:hypothetical protein [Candidatus Poribacteria bacterium]MYB64329.1 hypothetical protein [Candidatus Poribacteria bacterium]
MVKLTEMTQQVTSALARGINYLLTLQQDDGKFEGQLSASTFPSCAYAWIQLAQGETPSSEQIAWFINTQNEEGAWGLDTSKHSNPNATLFSKLILEQISEASSQSQIQDTLSKIPHHPLDLALLKLAYATFGRFDWHKLSISKKALPLMHVIKILKSIPVFRPLLKPPRHKLPPVDLFNTPLFQDLFIAEQHTLVPVFILIELNTSNRQDILESLVAWLKSKVLSDGSWFRVNYITALSVLTLIEVKKHGHSDSSITDLIQNGIQWLKSTQNPDGGYREALNLNVWDTALSVIALTEVEPDYITHTDAIENAAQWLVDQQNGDGGWAFSGMQDSALPSDADDTALATLAIIRSEQESRKTNSAIEQGIAWLKQNHGEDGSWSTYQPGQGDVGCVSITAHAIEALLTYTQNGENTPQIADGVKWLRAAIHNDGYWDDLWLAKRTYGTASALMALVKSGTGDVLERREGVRWLENSQNPDGGWGEDMFGNPTHSTIEQTAWSIYALLLSGAVNPTIQKGIDYLIRQQRRNGSWQESCVGIYWEIIGGYSDPIYASVFPILALNQYLKQTQ